MPRMGDEEDERKINTIIEKSSPYVSRNSDSIVE